MDFLNLGGDAGAMSQALAARVLDTTFLISATRPVFVAYSIRILLGAANENGRIELRSDRASPPTTVLARYAYSSTLATASEVIVTLSGLILPGMNVRIGTQAVVGAPGFTIQSQVEIVL